MAVIKAETKKAVTKTAGKKRSRAGVGISPARLKKMIKQLMDALEQDENKPKATISELLKLLHIYNEMKTEQVKEVEVRWVDRLRPDEEPET